MRRSLALALLVAIALSIVGAPSPASSQSSGRVYLVPLGPGVPVPMRELADHYRQTYKLNVIVLPELVLGDPRVQDTTRFQLVADELLGYMVRKNPKPSSEPGAAVIGVTAQDMYIRGLTWDWAFGYREGDRFAVVSTARMDPTWFAEPANPALLRTRLRKAVTRMIGFQHFGYRESTNRRSVLFGLVRGLDDLDRLAEDF
jgi:predicted Zn-dependent protease